MIIDLFEKEKTTKIEFRLKESEKAVVKELAEKQGQNITDFIKKLIREEYNRKNSRKRHDKNIINSQNEYLLDTVLSMFAEHKKTFESNDLSFVKSSFDTMESMLKVKFETVKK